MTYSVAVVSKLLSNTSSRISKLVLALFLSLAIVRPSEVTVEYQDVSGTTQRMSFKNIAARVVLHEYDHMEGLNFTQHASNFKLRWELNKLKKKNKKIQRKEKYGK